ncbi:MAG: NrsF family protein [Lysobacterales bacterium]
MNRNKELISELSSGLTPVSKPRGIDRLAAGWFVLAAVFVVAMTLLFGPARPGAAGQLAAQPRFLLETLLGLASIFWISLAAFRAAIPGSLGRRFMAGGLVLVALWLAHYVIGFISPALEPSSLGKRGHCALETVLYSLPVILAGLAIVFRHYPLHPVKAGMLVGLASGMLPALFMQIACMYEPAHILAYHVLPGLLMVGAGAGIAAWWHARRHH